jgi:hypothetical protein
MTEQDLSFNSIINHTHIEGPFDFHLVQVNKKDVYVYGHGEYLFKTEIPRVDPKYIDNVKELKNAQIKEIIRIAKNKVSDVRIY